MNSFWVGFPRWNVGQGDGVLLGPRYRRVGGNGKPPNPTALARRGRQLRYNQHFMFGQ